MFSVVTVCYDWEIHQPYIESVKGFKTRESAWEWACSAAEGNKSFSRMLSP